ncbi:MAG: hypothetical protein N2C12_11820 [Planctomycetales bacterium]
MKSTRAIHFYLGVVCLPLLAVSCSCNGDATDGSLKIIQIDGNQGIAVVQDGKICWQAMHCVNPDCLIEDPPYFHYPIPGADLDGNGEIKYPDVPLEKLMEWSTPPCPKCGQSGTVFPYLEPNTEKYMEKLKAELIQSRKVRDRTFSYNGVRTPTEIMKEMDRLQRTYVRSITKE